MKNNKLKLFAFTLLMGIGLVSCTNLEIEETDSFISAGFQGLENPSSTVDELYNRLNGQYGDQGNRFAMNEVTTDAAIVPTRGTDWGDNGQWSSLHQHLWTPEHVFVINTWNDWNANQLIASQVMDSRSNPSQENIGEASFVRALSMWVILDNYGQVPFRDVTLSSTSIPEILTGQAAIDFIMSDLDTAISSLPSVSAGSGDANGRASKAAARYLKAKILLNKHVYLGGSADGSDMASVISLVDEIAGEGYALQAGYFELFRDTPDTETVWSLKSEVGNRIFNGLHYNSLSQGGGGWNGFATLAEYFDLFEGDPNSNRMTVDFMPLDGQEERRGGVPPAGAPFTGAAGTADLDGFEDDSQVGNGFLVGQQYQADGTALQDRAGAPLTFKRDFLDGDGAPNIINNDETTGIRVIKYNPRYGAFNGHEIFFRYADAHLMKAEAMHRSGGDPTSMINDLRTLRKTATVLGSVTEQDILDERGRELFAESWRRNDMIRFGQYTRDWIFKAPGSVGNDTYNLFPIPTSQLLANPNLTQNPGY